MCSQKSDSRRNRVLYSLAICLAFVAFIADTSWGQPAAKSSTDSAAKSSSGQNAFEIIESVAIVSRSSPENMVRLDLGGLEGGSKGVVALTLWNRTDSVFDCSKISTSCGCLEVKYSSNIIQAGESIKVAVGISVPPKGVVKSSRESIRFTDTTGAFFVLELTYDLLGVANFLVAEVAPKVLTGADVCEFKVPLYFSRPISATDLSINGTGDLVKMKCVVLSEGGNYFAKCTMPLEVKGEFMLGGELSLEVLSRKIRHEIPCFISRQREIVVFPGIVRFELKDKKWIGEAMIRDNRKPGSRKDDLSIGVQGDNGLRISVLKTKVRDLYRLQLSFEGGTELKKIVLPKKLNWQVAWESGISEFDTPAHCVE